MIYIRTLNMLTLFINLFYISEVYYIIHQGRQGDTEIKCPTVSKLLLLAVSPTETNH